jgi:uncharacterized membrane protein
VTDAATRQYLLRLTPKPGLLGNVGMSVLLVVIPVFGVLTFLGIHNGKWRIGAVGALVTLVACIFVFVRYRSTAITVTDTAIEERGFWGGHSSFLRTDAASLDLVHTYAPGSPEPAPQLLVLDSDQRCLLRMRGAFWTSESMDDIASHLESLTVVRHEAMTAAEFLRRYPNAGYWFEKHPLAMGALVAALAVVTLTVIFALSTLVGMPGSS